VVIDVDRIDIKTARSAKTAAGARQLLANRVDEADIDREVARHSARYRQCEIVRVWSHVVRVIHRVTDVDIPPGDWNRDARRPARFRWDQGLEVGEIERSCRQNRSDGGVRNR